MKFLIICLALTALATAEFSSSAQEAIVKAHNDLRSSIAKGTYTAKGNQMPAAADMLKMAWDNTIASAAQEFAEQCPDDHAPSPYGENLYWSWDSEAIENLDAFGVDAAKSWEQEFQDYGWTSPILTQEAYDTGIGHATQMAWHNTNLIGCGVKNCGKDPKKPDMYKIVVVCQFTEKGNTVPEAIYKEGDSCSACPSGNSCESESGLCA